MESPASDIEMSQVGKEGKPAPQLSALTISAFDKTNPFSISSPTKTATTSQSRESTYPPWTPAAGTTKTFQSRESAFPPWTPISGESLPKVAVGMSIKAVRPPRPISKDPPRPTTASTKSTKRLTFSRFNTPRPTKYATGKDGEIELVPQPSDDSEDPLNWPLWRRNLSFFALLHMVALVGVMKTMFFTVNSDIALTNGVSYTATVALTAVPLMISALTGMMSVVVAKIHGKRPVYLTSTVMMFVGAMWGMYVMNSFSQNMASRVFQGIGWGAFDTLVLGSLQDTFFEHELHIRVIALNAVSVASTWGAPLLGGITSSGPRGFCLQYEILSIFLALGTWLVAFGVPESTFDRTTISMYNRDSLQSRPRLNWQWIRFSKEAARDYITRMKPWTYKASILDGSLLLQAPRAMIAPTTLLLFTVSLLPHVALWGFASSLSLLFSVVPFMLPSGIMGALFTGPFLFALVVAVALSLPLYTARFTSSMHSTTLAVGAVTASIGAFTFGLYIENSMTSSQNDTNELGTSWQLDSTGSKLSFPVVSFLLGLLAAGSLALDATIRPMIQRSTAFTSVNMSVGMRNTVDMHAGLSCLRNLVAGAFVLGIPNAVWAWEGLSSAALGIGITQFFVAGAVGCVWWQWEENVRRLDGKVMELSDLSTLALEKSFFDTS
ncbi:putative Major facilitator superfamily (MFS) profile domain-containing protein [Seiridium cardinale]